MKTFSVVFCLILFSFSPTFAGTLHGLRGGDLYIKTNTKCHIQITTKPTYGWKESFTFYDHQGKIKQKLYPSRKQEETYSFHIDTSYVHKLHLNRSYTATVGPTDCKVIYSSIPYITSFQTTYPLELFFSVPPNTNNLLVNLENRRGLQGQTGFLALKRNENGKSLYTKTIQKQSFSQADVAKALNVSGLNKQQALSDLSPTKAPQYFSPSKINLLNPQAGIWQLSLSSGRLGTWVEGVPNYFSSRPEDLFSMFHPLRKVKLKRGQKVPSPFLGAVGHFGHNGKYGDILNNFGVFADKLFLHGKSGADSLVRLGSKKYSKHTLLVIRSMPVSILKKPLVQRAQLYAEWAGREVLSFMNQTNIPLEQLTIQPFNEPNLEMSIDEYILFMSHLIKVCKSDPLLKKVRIAGPALGSRKSSNITEWNWIERILEEFGNDISVITWNCYKLLSPEDSYEFAEAIKFTRSIIESYGGKQEIIIGATNRMGGLAPNNLFNSDQAGLWWANMLIDGIGTGEVAGYYYFSTIDTGIRAKGLFSANGKPKKQAYVQKAVDDILQYNDVYSVESSSALVKGLLGVDSGKSALLLVNQSWFPASIDLKGFGIELERFDVLNQNKMTTPKTLTPNQCVIIRFKNI